MSQRTFTVVLQVNSTTPSGTNITDTAHGDPPTNIVPEPYVEYRQRHGSWLPKFFERRCGDRWSGDERILSRKELHSSTRLKRDQQRTQPPQTTVNSAGSTLPSNGHISFLHLQRQGTCSEAGGVVNMSARHDGQCWNGNRHDS